MSSKPLVLQIVPSLSVGGAERIAIELCSRLPAHGFRTRLAVLFESGTLWEEVRRRNVRWTQVLESREGSRIELIRRLSNIIYAEPGRRPAIVHAHLFGSDFWSMVARRAHAYTRLSSERGVPQPVFVSTAHNIDHEDGTFRRLLRRWAVRKMDGVVGVSEEVVRYVREDLGVRKQRVSRIDGMNILEADPRPPGPFHDPPRFITVGRLVPQKGHETILRALADVPPPWTYTIIGYGPLERDLKELAERLGIASRVRFAGKITDIADLLRESDVFLFPSHWEGLGLAALEAASVSLPVLASDLPPLRSVFPAGQRIPVDDPAAWARAIRSVLAHPDDALRSAERLTKSVVKRFHPESVTEQYAAYYRSALNPPHAIPRPNGRKKPA